MRQRCGVQQRPPSNMSLPPERTVPCQLPDLPRSAVAVPCISSLGSSGPGLIPCIISLDAALLSSIYTKSFGEPSPLGRRSPKPPTFEHGGPTPTRARTCGLRISTHTTHVHPFASAIRCHSRPSAPPRSPPAAPHTHAASSGHGAPPRYPPRYPLEPSDNCEICARLTRAEGVKEACGGHAAAVARGQRVGAAKCAHQQHRERQRGQRRK